MRLDLWGFILGILALVLAIPLGIASTLLTPKFQVWWAETSRQRALKRIRKLKIRAARLELQDAETFQDRRWGVLRLMMSVIPAMLIFGLGILAIILTVLAHDNTERRQLLIAVRASCAFSFVITMWGGFALELIQRDVSDKRYNYPQREIEKLRQTFEIFPEEE